MSKCVTNRLISSIRCSRCVTKSRHMQSQMSKYTQCRPICSRSSFRRAMSVCLSVCGVVSGLVLSVNQSRWSLVCGGLWCVGGLWCDSVSHCGWSVVAVDHVTHTSSNPVLQTVLIESLWVVCGVWGVYGVTLSVTVGGLWCVQCCRSHDSQ